MKTILLTARVSLRVRRLTEQRDTGLRRLSMVRPTVASHIYGMLLFYAILCAWRAIPAMHWLPDWHCGWLARAPEWHCGWLLPCQCWLAENRPPPPRPFVAAATLDNR